MAVWPPDDLVAGVASTVAALRAGAPEEAKALRWTGPEQWHVTLRFVGEADEDAAGAAFRAAAGTAGFGPATAVAGPATGRFGRRVLHLPVAGLEGLAGAVVAATAGVGEPPDDRPFAGHLTLARARDRRGADLRPFCGAALAGRWAVREVTLVASRPGRGGARYEGVDALTVPTEGPCPNTRSQLH